MICIKCNEDKDNTEFTLSSYNRKCKACKRAEDKEAYIKVLNARVWNGKFSRGKTMLPTVELEKYNAAMLIELQTLFLDLALENLDQLFALFARKHGVSTSLPKQRCLNNKWKAEIYNARKTGETYNSIILSEVQPPAPMNWHIEPWSMSASCYN